ncbi:MAG: trigger factor [Brevefilum sp.]
MNIEKEILEDRQAQLTVEYTPEEFEGYKRRAAKKISRNAKIPGFRPGKAPYQVVVNHYGEGTIVQEAFDLLIDDDYSKILDQADLEPFGPGNLETLENFDPPKFVLLVPLQPEVDLGDYREIRKAFEMEPFNPDDVDDYIMSLRRNSATIIPAEHPAEEGDLVYFTLSGEILNPEDEEDATITDKSPQQVVIPAEGEISEDEWPYPGFGRALLGVTDGGVKEVQYTYPEDYEDEDYQGKTAIFTVEVQSVKALELPEFDDVFVQNLGNFESPEDFREKIENQMQEEHKANYEMEYINAILAEAIENAQLKYPPQMLEHEVEHVLEDIKSRLKNQNLDYDTYLKLRGIDEDTLIAEEIEPVAKQRLERSLVVDALIEAEGLKLNQELLHEQVNGVVNEIFRSGKADELQKEMGENEFSRMVTMEGVSRTMDVLLKDRLMLIGTGQPIPEDVEEDEPKIEELEETDIPVITDVVEPVSDSAAQENLEESGESDDESPEMDEVNEDEAPAEDELLEEPIDAEVHPEQTLSEEHTDQETGAVEEEN